MVQFSYNRARYFKSLARLPPELYITQPYYLSLFRCCCSCLLFVLFFLLFIVFFVHCLETLVVVERANFFLYSWLINPMLTLFTVQYS